MSNHVGIYPTRFVTIDLQGNEQDVSYGLRVADDNDSTYSNLFETDEIVGKSPTEIVEIARGIDDRARDIIEFAEEQNDGIHIGDDPLCQ
jgi:hypothetical protein